MKSTICLNMIVKNESHLILNTLINLVNNITFKYWVICDTGSSDNTREIIQQFFDDKKIPGLLINSEWKDFAYNRTIALKHAYNKKTDYIFIFDADDSIQGNLIIPAKLESDIYSVIVINKAGNVLYRVTKGVFASFISAQP